MFVGVMVEGLGEKEVVLLRVYLINEFFGKSLC